MRLFILYNLQLEIINFLYKNLRKTECWKIGATEINYPKKLRQ